MLHWVEMVEGVGAGDDEDLNWSERAVREWGGPFFPRSGGNCAVFDEDGVPLVRFGQSRVPGTLALLTPP